MGKTLPYILVDVFADQPFGGNPLAVFRENDALSAELMQKIAGELNLSETTFLFPSDKGADKKVRIFTPRVELPVAGHPTIGTAYVLAEEGWIETREGINAITLEEGVGNIRVTVHRESGRITRVEMNQPIPVFGKEFPDREEAAELLSLEPGDIHPDVPIQTGVPFLYIPVRSLAAVRNIRFRRDVWEKRFAADEATRHIFVFTMETVRPEASVHGRMFAPAMGIHEDPATGIASGPSGAYLVEYGLVRPQEPGRYHMISEQGVEMGRPSAIAISVTKLGGEYREVKIGGCCVKIGSGQLILP